MLEELRRTTDAHLRLVDEKVPNLVTGLLIVGSVPLGDYQPGMSDIDFVAVTDRAPTPAELVVLERLHASLPKLPNYDGIYLTRAQLARTPTGRDTAPQVLAGNFDPAKPGGQLSPVTWLELATNPIAVRGERPHVRQDEPALREWLLGNLSGYWTHWTFTAREHWAARRPTEHAFEDSIIWGVLGPARLRYTLLTGSVISKSDAGRFAAQRYPAWRELCARAVQARAGAQLRFTAADGVAACDLMAAVIAG